MERATRPSRCWRASAGGRCPMFLACAPHSCSPGAAQCAVFRLQGSGCCPILPAFDLYSCLPALQTARMSRVAVDYCAACVARSIAVLIQISRITPAGTPMWTASTAKRWRCVSRILPCPHEKLHLQPCFPHVHSCRDAVLLGTTVCMMAPARGLTLGRAAKAQVSV